MHVEALTPRQRIKMALQHKESDRVPLDLGGGQTTIEVLAYDELKRLLGIDKPTVTFERDHVEVDEEVLRRFRIDTRYVRQHASSLLSFDADNSYVDEWGLRRKKPPSCLYWEIVGSPLSSASLDDLKKHKWPDPHDPRRVEGLREYTDKLYETTGYAVVLNAPTMGVVETAWFLRGMERFLTDLILDRRFVEALLDKVCEILTEIYRSLLAKVGNHIDVVIVSDDLGTQESLFFSPDLYRKIIKPYHTRFWQAIKSRTRAALFLHSCGAIYDLIPDLIEQGVDILNPVQPTAKGMDTLKIKKEFAKDICFWGAIDVQHVLPHGKPEDVRQEVKKRIEDLAPGGGYILSPSHNIQPGVPPENILSMYEAAMEFGGY